MHFHRDQFVVLLLIYTLAVKSFVLAQQLATRNESQAEPRPTSRRGPRFLGLLGLLTGLTLVDSLDDDSDRPRRSGYVKIDVGRPSTLDPFYGAYGYSAPYWTGAGGSSINIKIPFRPGGSEFETMAVFPFPVPFPQVGPTHFGASAVATIEPRPSLFADTIPNVSSAAGSGVQSDEVEQQPATRKQKLTLKKPTTNGGRLSPPRTIRSTTQSEADDGDDTGTVEAPETTDTIEPQDPPVPMIEQTDVSTANTSSDQPATTEQTEPAEPASIVQAEINYVTQPAIPASYRVHPHSLTNVATIELTTSTPFANEDTFQPSHTDQWRNYYSSFAQHHRQLGFLPIALPAS
ncbi:uncharacterized protein LOC128728822 [Anopheles nili]|uniref:uncharacterized protein LOC128728822 n=1 Tax=Anopheles nili TaxID=185578 RepID=UPI00237B0B67|nr:uncharacterized protein LOC128728822 [Anopheles nili]